MSDLAFFLSSEHQRTQQLPRRKRSRADMQSQRRAASSHFARSFVIFSLFLSSFHGISAFVQSSSSSSRRRTPTTAFVGVNRLAQKPTSRLEATVEPALSLSRLRNKPNKSKQLQGPLAPTLDSQRNMTMSEMASMTAVGTVFSIGIVYILATKGSAGGVSLETVISQDWLGVADTVIDAALPLTASDVVSVALGEGLAGAIGSVALFALSFVLRKGQKLQQGQAAGSLTSAQALADGDFLVARAAALPLLEAIGLPPFLATITSVAFATVPYEIVKLGSRRRNSRIAENETLQRLLDASKQQEMNKGRFSMVNLGMPLSVKKANAQVTATADLASLKPVQDYQSDGSLDLVEVFSDITKWLSYDVLSSEFGGRLTWEGYDVSSGLEGALFGSLASLSAQLYADILYVYFEFGSQKIQDQVKARTASEWSAIYLSRILVGATLFGVYEAVQSPTTSLVSAFLSGGVSNCIESQDYNMCMETFLAFNPPELATASSAGEFRALATAFASLLNRYTPIDLYELTTASPAGELRALATTFASLVNRFTPIDLYG